MKITVFLACLSLAFARRWAPSERIIGGDLAPEASRPYHVSVLSSTESHFQYCSGALVHPKWVVTAGNCASFDDVYVGLGFTNLLDKATGTHVIKGTWHLHEHFDYQTLDNDLALIELATEVPLSAKIKTIKIAKSETDVGGGTNVLVSGWGATTADRSDPYKLRQVVLQILDRKQCDARYVHETITDNMICTESNAGKDTCWSDEGGPLVTNFSESSFDPSSTLVGVVSWQWGCADASSPGMNTRVSKYCSWFQTTTGGDVKC